MGTRFKIRYDLPTNGSLYGEVWAEHPPTIRIRSDLTGVELHKTLLHEILHAVLELSGQNQSLRDKQEEAIVRALENGLYGLVALSIYNPKAATPDEE